MSRVNSYLSTGPDANCLECNVVCEPSFEFLFLARIFLMCWISKPMATEEERGQQ